MLPGSLCRRVWVCLPGRAGLASRPHVLCTRTGPRSRKRPVCSPMLRCRRREKGPTFSACAGSGRRWSWPASSVSLTPTSGPEVCLLLPGSGREHRVRTEGCVPASPYTAHDRPSRLFSMGAGFCGPSPRPAPLAGILSEESRQISWKSDLPLT